MKVRQSGLGNADTCLRRFQYDLESPRDVYHSGSARAIGTGYHSGREEMYGRRTTGEPPLTLDQDLMICFDSFDTEVSRAGEHFLWDDKFPDRTRAIDVLGAMVSAYHQQDCEWPEDFRVLGVEVYFDLPFVEGHTRSGSIDLVVEDSQGWIIGVDHKTAGRAWPQGKEHPRKNNQGPWYVRGLQELFPGAPGYRFVFDIMTYGQKFERRIADPELRHIAAVESKALSVIALYDGLRSSGMDLPGNPSSTLCSPKYCDFWTLCPHGSVLE